MTASLALEMRGISKGYHGNPVLREVDFSVRQGSVHALLGANGAGKSTLMKIATGNVLPDHGQIFVAGAEVQPGHPQSLHKAGLGMVYQDLSLIDTLSVSANVFLGRDVDGARRRPYLQRRLEIEQSEQLFKRIGVQVKPEAEVRDLSLADRQIVEIAKALVVARECLILDEPTTALSAREVDRLFGVMAQLRESGMGIIFITHHLQEVFEACDEVTVLRDGNVSFRGQPKDSSTSELVRAMVASDVPSFAAPASKHDRATNDVVMAVQDLTVRDRLRDASFELRSGEILGVLGLAGSGSNELVRGLAGIEPGSTGRVSVRGENIRVLTNPRAAIEAGLYLIPASRKSEGLVLGASVHDNVTLSALRRLTRFGLLQSRRMRRQVSDSISSLQIKARSGTQLVDELSGGNQQKVVLAKALSTNASILLLEEPTFGVDIQASFDIAELVRSLVDNGGACIWLTTDLRELAQVSDRIVHVQNGAVVEIADNHTRELSEAQLLETVHSTSSHDFHIRRDTADRGAE